MNEIIKTSLEDKRKEQGRLWITGLLNEPTNFSLYTRFAASRCRGQLLKGKHFDVISLAIERMARMIENASKEEKPSDKAFRKQVRNALDASDQTEFSRLFKIAFYAAIKWSALDVVKDEWDEFSMTDSISLLEDSLDIPAIESTDESAHKIERWELGEVVCQRWFAFLGEKRDRERLPSQQNAVSAVIAWEKLALCDLVPVRVQDRKKNDDNPSTYHWILGLTQGQQGNIAERHGISIRALQAELKKMRNVYWPEFEAKLKSEGL